MRNFIILFFVACSFTSYSQTTYTFNGNGKWSDSVNWLNRIVPPSTLDSGSQIIVNPFGNGVCILDTLQFISYGASLTFAQNKKVIVAGDIYITDTSDNKMPSKRTAVSFGLDVPAVIIQQTDSIYSALGAIKAGVDSMIKIIKYKEDNLIFGLNNQNEIMLISMVNKNDTSIILDAKSSAIAMVRFTLNPFGTGNYNSQQLNIAIQSAPSFSVLLNTIQQQLILGNAILNSDSAISKAQLVANEIVIANGGLILGRPLDNQKYYFIDGLLKGENLWFENVAGSDVKFFNDTRLYWQVTSRNEQGTIITPQKELDWLPFKWQEIIPSLNPPTETAITVVNSPNNSAKFTVTLEQNNVTKTKHFLFLMQNLGLTLLDYFGRPGAAYSKELECSGEFAKAILNDKMPQLLTQPSGTVLLQYMTANLTAIDAPWYYVNSG